MPARKRTDAEPAPDLPEEMPQPDYYGLAEKMRHVHWLGGSPCAGKSSVASILAERHGLQLYSCDEHFEEHKARLDPDKQPTFASLAALTCDELWLRPVQTQIETELAYCRDIFDMVIEDLFAMPSSPPIVAEGTDLLPWGVAPLLADAHHAFWLVPTVEFQYSYYSRRDWVNDVLNDCTQPAKAFSNWMARDAGFADRIEETAAHLGLPVFRVDGRVPILEIVRMIEQHFRLMTAGEISPQS